MYIIWHDNDYDFALWVYQNTNLKLKENVILRQIPKTNNESLLTNDFKDDTDYFILPYIKFATPDLLIQKIENGESKIVFASEFMTHTPQHDHVMQRFERIFCISKEKIPVACILPENKVKIEKGSKMYYKPTSYKPNPLVIHTYLKTTQINQNPTLVFFWPHKNGYLKFDSHHQTAPKIEGQIIKWIDFLNICLDNKDPTKILLNKIVVDQLDFLENKYLFNSKKFFSISFEEFINYFTTAYKSLVRAKLVNTNLLINEYFLDKTQLSDDFKKKENTIIFQYNSKKFRTDPYAGFLCGVLNLFCINNQGKKIHNLVLIPNGIKYSLISSSKKNNPTFKEISEDFNKCSVHSSKNLKKFGLTNLIDHVHKGCTYTYSKQQRIFGVLPDIIIFVDKILYNKNHGY